MAIKATQAGAAVFHLGWEQPVYLRATAEIDAAALVEGFLRALDTFRAAGGVVVWTIHNLEPHEERFPSVNATMQRGLALRADVVHVHNRRGADHARASGARPDSMVLVRHPNYAESYPNDITDQAARRYLGLNEDDIVFTFFGAVRDYKGLPRLMRAFDTASVTLASARLVIAGRSSQPCQARALRPNPRLRVLLRDIADAEIQYVMRAADCVVLPYEAILTSGVLALAQGFGRPVIVPDLPSMIEEVTDGDNGFLFKAGSDEALTGTLRHAAATLSDVRGRMRAAAHAAVREQTFSGLAKALDSSVETRMPRRRAA